MLIYLRSPSLAGRVSPCVRCVDVIMIYGRVPFKRSLFPPVHFSSSVLYFGLNLWTQYAFTVSRLYAKYCRLSLVLLCRSPGRISCIGCGASFACIHISKRNSYLDSRLLRSLFYSCEWVGREKALKSRMPSIWSGTRWMCVVGAECNGNRKYSMARLAQFCCLMNEFYEYVLNDESSNRKEIATENKWMRDHKLNCCVRWRVHRQYSN